jgi:1,4-alpha-glucan branching enzyme
MMGSEFGQWNEWHFEQSLDWHLLDQQDEDGERHRQLQRFFKAANALYLASPALWQQDFSWEGFRWICPDDNQGNTVLFLRFDKKGRALLVAVNFSPVFRAGYHIGVPWAGRYEEVFNTDAVEFGGEGRHNAPVKTTYDPCHGQPQSLRLDLPPLGAVVLKCAKKFPPRRKKAPPAPPTPQNEESR